MGNDLWVLWMGLVVVLTGILQMGCDFGTLRIVSLSRWTRSRLAVRGGQWVVGNWRFILKQQTNPRREGVTISGSKFVPTSQNSSENYAYLERNDTLDYHRGNSKYF